MKLLQVISLWMSVTACLGKTTQVSGVPLPLRRGSHSLTPANTYSLRVGNELRKGIRAPTHNHIRNAPPLFQSFIPVHVDLFSPFSYLPHVELVPVRTVYYRRVEHSHPVLIQEEGEDEGEGYITVARFPSQIGPAFQTRGSENALEFSAPAGIVKSSQPTFERIPFRNSKISPQLLRSSGRMHPKPTNLLTF